MNITDKKNHFFFEYIYYRVTQLFFKRDGRTGFTGIAVISLAQALSIEAIILELTKWLFSPEQRASHSKEFGYLGVAIGLIFMYYNYKKFNGNYNKYRFYWQNESKATRLLKGFYILLTFLFPITLIILLGVHWD